MPKKNQWNTRDDHALKDMDTLGQYPFTVRRFLSSDFTVKPPTTLLS